MADLAGWIIQVATCAEDGKLFVQHWYANIAAKQQAAAAVRKVAGHTTGTSINALTPLTKDIFAELGISKGSVQRARKPKRSGEVTKFQGPTAPLFWITDDED